MGEPQRSHTIGGLAFAAPCASFACTTRGDASGEKRRAGRCTRGFALLAAAAGCSITPHTTDAVAVAADAGPAQSIIRVFAPFVTLDRRGQGACASIVSASGVSDV